MNSDAALPADYLEFRAAFPDTDFLEFPQRRLSAFLSWPLPRRRNAAPRRETQRRPYAFIDGQVALIERFAANNGEWTAPSFRALASEMLVYEALDEEEMAFLRN